MVTILMMPAKMATLGLLEIMVYWNKGCNVVIFVYDVSNKILPGDSNSQFYKDLTRKTLFWGVNLVMALDTGYNLQVLHQCGKGLENKSQNALGANSYVCRCCKGKNGREGFFGSSILNRINRVLYDCFKLI